jgi:hypothetical protein
MDINKLLETVPEEQINYANLLFWGAWLGILCMFLTYLVYVLGILSPYIPIEKVPGLWSLSVTEYVKEYNVPIGWGWFGLIGYGDFLNFLGIALLAGMTVICYLPLIPTYLRRKDMAMATIVIAEIIVLSTAASGILGSAGH